MKPIIIKHIIEETKFTLNFDLQDGSLSFPTLELNIEGDVDLNSLVIKLTEILETNRILQFEFIDSSSFLESSPKLKLIKSTLEEIYVLYNGNFEEKLNTPIAKSTENDPDDLPF